MKQKQAIVVGAGIGGPVLGLWLRRLGWEVTMLESRSRIEPGEGAFMGLAPNGMLALDQLGLGDRALGIGYACDGFTFLNPAGKCIGTIDRSRDRERLGWPLTMVRRGELHALLARAATDAGVALRLGAKVVDIRDESPGPVEVAVEDGTTLSGDVLFGCDGTRSTVRHLSMPNAPAPEPSGLLDFGGFSTAGIPFPPGVNVMVFGRRAFFGAFATTEGETWWFHNGPTGEAPEGHRVRMLALHEDDPPWVRDLIEGTDTILGPWPLHQLPSLPRWHHGRVCLLGDAAHAMSPSAGQGASMAIEDAVAIARSLRDHADPVAAFRGYEQGRRERVESIARAARRNDGGKKGTNPVAAFIRDRMMGLFMPRAAAQQTRMYAHQEVF